MLWLVVICVILLSYVLLIGILEKYWVFDNDPIRQEAEINTGITVLIPVRNEAYRIMPLLHSLKQIVFPKSKYEVIFIDDHSEDDTCQIIKEACISNVRIVHLPLNESGKKSAINYGVQYAAYDIIVCTDGDCVVPSSWLTSIILDFQKYHWNFCAMPVVMQTTDGCWNTFQVMEFLGLMGVTYVANERRWFYMANGANMAFTRSAFLKVNGYNQNKHISSGDDIFMIHQLAEINPERIRTLFCASVIVKTNTLKDYRGFIQQRIRWGSKMRTIKGINIGGVMMMTWLMSASIIFLLIKVISDFEWLSLGGVGIIVLTKFYSDYRYLDRLSKDMGIVLNKGQYACAALINIVYVAILSPMTLLMSSYTWKGKKRS